MSEDSNHLVDTRCMASVNMESVVGLLNPPMKLKLLYCVIPILKIQFCFLQDVFDGIANLCQVSKFRTRTKVVFFLSSHNCVKNTMQK